MSATDITLNVDPGMLTKVDIYIHGFRSFNAAKWRFQSVCNVNGGVIETRQASVTCALRYVSCEWCAPVSLLSFN